MGFERDLTKELDKSGLKEKVMEPVVKWVFDKKSAVIGGISTLAVYEGVKAGYHAYVMANADKKADRLEKKGNKNLEKAAELRSLKNENDPE